MKNGTALIIFALSTIAAPALAQDAAPSYTVKPYTLTEADAAAINLRRLPEWNPHHVSAGDVFEIYTAPIMAVIIPTTGPATGGGTVTFEDLESIDGKGAAQ
ncbi:MAG TPA: hypothetical protein VK749_15905 [Xanthobacteraceae bacterium]|jgi:hypothetical protein|nr:hypothetical protein [Xanthobacteraceae bacterium]